LNFFWAWDFANLELYTGIGLAGLIILALMTATSTDTAMRKMGKNWRRLHLFIYIVLLLAIVHSFTIGKIFLSSTEGQAIIAVIAAIIVVVKFTKLRGKPKTISGEKVESNPSSQR